MLEGPKAANSGRRPRGSGQVHHRGTEVPEKKVDWAFSEVCRAAGRRVEA